MKPIHYAYVYPGSDPEYVGPEVRKIIYGRHSLGALKILKPDGTTQVNAYNFANYLYPYTLRTSEATRLVHPIGRSYIGENPGHYWVAIEGLYGLDTPTPRNTIFWNHPQSTPLQLVRWSHPDEENTDIEQPDKFFWVSKPETAADRSKRLQDELTEVARKSLWPMLAIKDIPELLGNYSEYGGDVTTTTWKNFLRNGITGFKACVGYLQSKLSANTITQTDEDAIYELYAYFHTADTRDGSGVGIDFYNMCFELSPASGWDGAYSGKVIRMPNPDGTAGRILRDVVFENTSAGNYDAAAGSAEYQRYATTDFQTAYFHFDRTNAIEELYIEEYVPAKRNTNLSTLRLWISSAAAGAELTFTEAFDADTLTYTGSTTWGARETVFIEATTENPNATIAGNGLVNTVVGINELEVVVTSQDGHATKTYTINTTRT